MTYNLIIGEKSYITNSINKFLKNKLVLSANDINKNLILNKIKNIKKINIIFNNFYPAKLLNNLNVNEYEKFSNLSISKILLILNTVPAKKINKIIYSSSSVIYKVPESINDISLDRFNRNLYSSFKLAAEKIISNYSNYKKKPFFICRIFNTYGNNKDTFSFIEKVIENKKRNKKLTLINNGTSIRDFIHLDDIGKIYLILLTKKIKSGIYDLGTGKGYQIRDIVDFVKIPKQNIKRIQNIKEIQNSIAQNNKLLKEINDFRFRDLEKYLRLRLKIKSRLKLKSSKPQSQNYINIGTVIYGFGFAGKQIFEELKKNNEDVFFFVDDDIKKQNNNYQGIPIISYNDLIKIKNYTKIKTVYLAIPSLNKKELSNKLKNLKKYFFDVRFLPEKKFLLSDRIDINDFNINQINNILNRKQIKSKKIKSLIKKNIIVTGAAGTIGSEICRQLLQQDVKKIIAIDKSEIGIYNLQKKIDDHRLKVKLLDINDLILLDKIFSKEKIDFVFHAAAYKHLNILENNIFSAVRNNVFATHNICSLSEKYKSNMVFISTDKAANPKSVLGYTKRTAEKICEYFNFVSKNNYIKIVRFGNVFGSSGSAITNFIDQINADKPINLTDARATRYFMTIFEACNLVLQTININSKGKIYVLNMGKPINILKIAKQLGKIKSNIKPSYKFSFNSIGLKPGEKLHETIFDKTEIKTKYNNEIFLVRKKKTNFKKENFLVFISKLHNYYNLGLEKKLLNCLTKIRIY